MDLAAPGGVRLDRGAAPTSHLIKVLLTDEAVVQIQSTRPESAVLRLDPESRQPVLQWQSTKGVVMQTLPSSPELVRVLEQAPRLQLAVQVSTEGLVRLTGQVSSGIQGSVAGAQVTQVILEGQLKLTSAPQPVVVKPPVVNTQPLPPVVAAMSQINRDEANHALHASRPVVLGPVQRDTVEFQTQTPAQLAQAVARSIEAIGGGKPMLIPDVSPAIPRPVAPDALPSQVPIRQPIANELGLKAGQVVQALVASSGDKMALQLGQHQLPLPANAKLAEGPVALRVVQTPQGLALAPQLAAQVASQPQAGQAAAVSGLSAALAQVITKSGARPQTQSLFAANGLERQLTQAGLGKEAQVLAGQRLLSSQLTGAQIASALQFGGLANEKALLNGVSLQGGMLKPWLRQMLRLLPSQSELTMRIGELVSELESLQLEALPQQGTRESGMSAVLLFRDQPPVELLFEREEVGEGEDRKHLWVVNLHTSLEHLGEVWLKSVFESKNVELTLWAADSQTAKLARSAKMDLEEALSEHGLTVKTMHIFDAPRPGHRDLSQGAPHMDLEA
jgi:hypothetical protein